MDQYFDQINKIISGKKTSSRVSFMLRDVVDLRKNKWVPRRGENSYLYNYLYDPQNKGKMHGFYNSFFSHVLFLHSMLLVAQAIIWSQ